MIVHQIEPSPFVDYKYLSHKGRRFCFPSYRRIANKISQEISLLIGKYFADLILTVNKLSINYLISKKIAQNKIILVRNGIDLKYIQNLESNSSPLKYNPDGVFLGRFHPQKGIFDLIEIWKKVVERNKNLRLVIIGEGSSSITERIRKYIKKNLLEKNVEMVGFLEEAEKYSVLKKSRIFLFPSYLEGFGIVILEAMACGNVVIAFDLPVYKDIFNNVIVRVPIGEISEFADKVLAIFDSIDVQREYLSHYRNFLSKFDWDVIAEMELQYLMAVKIFKNSIERR